MAKRVPQLLPQYRVQQTLEVGQIKKITWVVCLLKLILIPHCNGMKTTRLRTNSCLGIPRSVTGFRGESWAKLMALFNSSNRPSLFCLGAGLLCSMILLIHRQNNGSFRERTLKKQKTRIISCGKHSGKSEYTHNLIEETTHKVAFICLTFPTGNLCHCLRFHLFQTPSRDLPLG